MALKLYQSSGWWYGVFSVNGQRKTVNLQVKVQGRRPDTLRSEGDVDFERSRAEAQIEHDRMKRVFADDRLRGRMIGVLRAEEDQEWILVRDLEKWARRELRASGRGDGHVKAVCKTIKGFAERFPDGRYAHEVSAKDVRRWFAGLKGAARTRNRKRGDLRWLFNRLKEFGFVDRSPVDGVRPAEGPSRRREPLSDVEVAAVIANAGEFLPVVLAGVHTGMRLSDCAKLRMEDVDRVEGWITVRTAKTGARVEIPIHPDLLEVLPGKSAGYAWPRWARQKVSSLTHRYIEVRRAAGVEKDFHCLRVTWVTRAISAGVPVDVVRKVTGHRTVETVLEHYLHPDRDGIRDAFSRAGLISTGGDAGVEDLVRKVRGLSGEQVECVSRFLERLLSEGK